MLRYCIIIGLGESLMTNTYHFISRWRVRASAEEVYDIIRQPLEYPRWWPSVYLDSREIAAGNPDGTGRRVQFHTKGLLPYTLRWQSSVVEAVPPLRLVIEATGDFTGSGIWSLVQDGEYVDMAFDWKVAADKPLLRYLTPVLRPVFAANHRWAMQQGEISLREELIRYRARVPEDLFRGRRATRTRGSSRAMDRGGRTGNIGCRMPGADAAQIA